MFGRGGEEALALAEAGIPFEVVPGVSSAVAAPALAGIPVTHRGMSTGFAVVAGHAESAWRPAIESLAPNSLTVVVLMGLGQPGRHRQRPHRARLVRRHPGRRRVVRVAASGSTWRGTLAGLAEADLSPEAALADAPGTIVIGEVVSLAEALAPAAEQPLTAAGGSR